LLKRQVLIYLKSGGIVIIYLKNGEISYFSQLITLIDSTPRKQSTLLIGIDGCGGAGKSTFANRLSKECSSVTVVHMDDFYLPSTQIIDAKPAVKPIGADFDWKRVLNNILVPVSQNIEGAYQRYDWETDSLAEWHNVPVGGIVIIEGVYSIRKELADLYDLTIWVDCPRGIRLLRGMERDGEEAKELWENNWMIAEDIYVEAHKPIERADIVVKGTN